MFISLHNRCIVCHLQYILTPSVRRNLCDLVRIVSIGRHPVLLQGETSVGKTSLITYLGKASGNLCVRINNHEHTDLQEYIGSYSADEQGRLVFREGRLLFGCTNDTLSELPYILESNPCPNLICT
jgi:midasin (ATPase involved in ribosome maturation)